ncbi:hypothetical protein BYT27DRAFT_7219040 [Phlegmacium glaucopus]|nr:hypothetical protein BYT27DRAFT_7219040 [Phlegmacium glaucopus]
MSLFLDAPRMFMMRCCFSSWGILQELPMLFSPNMLALTDDLQFKIIAAILISGPYDLVAMQADWPSAIHGFVGSGSLTITETYQFLNNDSPASFPKRMCDDPVHCSSSGVQYTVIFPMGRLEFWELQ